MNLVHLIINPSPATARLYRVVISIVILQLLTVFHQTIVVFKTYLSQLYYQSTRFL